MPRPRRSGVAVILALLLIAAVIPTPTAAADPTPVVVGATSCTAGPRPDGASQRSDGPLGRASGGAVRPDR